MRALIPVVILCAACGIDALGTKVDEGHVGVGAASSSSGGTLPPDGGGAPVDASGDATRPAPTTPLCPQTDGALVACFPFEGSVTDESPARLTPLMAANLTFAPGREGQGVRLALSPKSDLRLPHDKMNTAQMTIELWINPASMPPSGGRSLLVDQNGRFGVTLQSDGTLQCRSVNATTKAVIGQWRHLACVHDGAQLTAYVDGVFEATAPNTLGTTSDFIGIGEDSTSTADSFDGVLDNLRIWTRALSPSEVSAAAAR